MPTRNGSHRPARHSLTPLSVLMATTLLLLLTACSQQGPLTLASSSSASSTTAPTKAQAIKTESMPPTKTDCPANGTGRAAVTAPWHWAEIAHRSTAYM